MGITEDSNARLPKNQKMQNEKRRSFLLKMKATASNATIAPMERRLQDPHVVLFRVKQRTGKRIIIVQVQAGRMRIENKAQIVNDDTGLRQHPLGVGKFTILIIINRRNFL